MERLTFYVRAAGATTPLIGAIPTAVQWLDPNLPVMRSVFSITRWGDPTKRRPMSPLR